MSARDDVLARIRVANQRTGSVPPVVPRAYATTGPRAAGSAEVLDLLEERLVDYRATVTRTGSDAVAAAVAAALGEASRVVVPAGLPEGWRPDESVVDDGTMTARDLDGCDAVVTAATAACAVTGTIVLDGSADQGRRALTLVPDLFVCVLRADQVVETVPELLARLDPVRPLTFVSGPSATSDIELDRVEGVHGPRTLHVVVVAG